MRLAVFLFPALLLAQLGKEPEPPDPLRGKVLFASCAGCHSADTDQKKMGPSLRSLFGRVTLRNGRRADDVNVRDMILDGYNAMPSFRYSFRPAEIDDLMAFLHTLKAAPAQTAGADGEKLFRSFCLRCHDTNSRTAAGPDLRGHYQDAWDQLIRVGHAKASPMKDWLDATAIESLEAYLKTH